MNISNFIQWFITQFINIGAQMINKIDNIYLVGNVSLLDFIITITIIQIFLQILIAVPNKVGREVRKEKGK